MISRRGLLTTGLALLAAPAIVRVTSLMPVKTWAETTATELPFASILVQPDLVPVMANPNDIMPVVLDFPVAPGQKIWRGDTVVLGADGYVRSAHLIVPSQRHIIGVAAANSEGWRKPHGAIKA